MLIKRFSKELENTLEGIINHTNKKYIINETLFQYTIPSSLFFKFFTRKNESGGPNTASLKF
jgi:hypothetical protein